MKQQILNLYIVILAAGRGKRMNSEVPKVLVPLYDEKPMIECILQTALSLEPKKLIVVVGFQGEKVIEATKEYDIKYVWQKEQLGTGHAVKMTKPLLQNMEGDVLVLYGDTPLVERETLEELYRFHVEKQSIATILTTVISNPTGYGRIIRNQNDEVQKMVEDKDATVEEKNVNEINSGMYVFQIQPLLDALEHITNHNVQQEYYLPDVINYYLQQHKKIHCYSAKNSHEILGINTTEQLQYLREIFSNAKQNKYEKST